MDITDIRIRRVNGEGKLKAYVTVTFDECFVIHNVKVIEGKTGEYKDIAHPISPDFRARMQDAIVEAFDRGDDSGEPPVEQAE